ncbi:hypothetical protein SDC9_108846 [bioreactor metagenome]|uniref:Uncharacterized protein n=1 Tax=bioreactor metagenome TaxID=1076179 RepID=A0A645BBE0_9ZZZZ
MCSTGQGSGKRHFVLAGVAIEGSYHGCSTIYTHKNRVFIDNAFTIEDLESNHTDRIA